MQYIDLIFIAYCVYVPFLILLYIAEVFIILKPGSPFKGTFYTLFVAAAVVDIMMAFCTFHEFRMLYFPIVNGMFANYDCGACIRIRITISYICPFTQDILNSFVAFSRVTSIRRPIESNQYDTALITIIEEGLTSLIIIILYSVAYISLKKLATSSKVAKKERMLLKIGVVNFVIAIPVIFYQILLTFQILPVEWTFALFNLWGLLVDVKFLSAPIALIVVNKSFRKHLLIYFRVIRANNVFSKSVAQVTVEFRAAGSSTHM